MGNLGSNDKLAIGLALGLLFGTLLDNLALGLVIGVVFGSIAKRYEHFKINSLGKEKPTTTLFQQVP